MCDAAEVCQFCAAAGLGQLVRRRNALQQCRMATACSAAVPHHLLFSVRLWQVAPERGHGDSEVAALLLDFEKALLIGTTPMILEQSPI